MNSIFLLLGSNLGDRLDNLRKAVTLLSKKGINVKSQSSVYESEPWGKSEQNWFLNVVIEVKTLKNPHQLLETCLTSETELGRKRVIKWGPRVIDIDILYFEDKILDSSELRLPHPGIPDRRFTLLPLVEIASAFVDPKSGMSQSKLLEICQDKLNVNKTSLLL